MVRPPKKIVKRASPETKSAAPKQTQPKEVVHSPEYLSSEDAVAQAEQGMGELEVT